MDRRLLLGGTVACSVLAVAACGGSSGAQLSNAQLAAKVNAACTSYVKASTAIPQPRDFTTNPTSAAAYLDKLKPLVESEHSAIAGLTPSTGVRAQFEQFRAASTHQLGLFESALAKAHAKDPSGLRELVAASSYKRTVLVPLERSLGFTACAR
jgi:hypothetical protein